MPGDAAGWFISGGALGQKMPTKKNGKAPKFDGERVTPDEIEAVLAEPAGAGKKLVGGLKDATAHLNAIVECGLTPEALVVLVTNKCRTDRNGNATSAATVQRVLEALFRLPEYLSK